jgi:hypothetical protein
MVNGFNRWAESERPARSGGADKIPAEKLSGAGLVDTAKVAADVARKMYNLHAQAKEYTPALKAALRSSYVPDSAKDMSHKVADGLEKLGLGLQGCGWTVDDALEGAKRVYNFMRENKEFIHQILESDFANPDGKDYGKKTVAALKFVGLGEMKDGEEYSDEAGSEDGKEGMGFLEGGVTAATRREMARINQERAQARTGKVGTGKKSKMGTLADAAMVMEKVYIPSAKSMLAKGVTAEKVRKHFLDKGLPYDTVWAIFEQAKEGKVQGRGGAKGDATYMARASPQTSTQHDLSEMAPMGEMMGSGKKKKSPSARNLIVKKVMREKGLSLPQASKYVKEHGLY